MPVKTIHVQINIRHLVRGGRGTKRVGRKVGGDERRMRTDKCETRRATLYDAP
jgi:hypothetical protein